MTTCMYCVHSVLCMHVYISTQYCVCMYILCVHVYTVGTQYCVYIFMFQFEQINSVIALEQSLTDRTKKKFNPVM